MARSKQGDGVQTVERANDAPDGAPLRITTPTGKDPAPDVSNAEVNLADVSLDSAHSETVENPDPNPLDLNPAPGPSAIEVLGKPSDSDEPANIGGEDGR